MLKRILLAATLVCSAGHIALGQRLVRTLRPPERPEGEELKFDTNLSPLTNLSLSPGAAPRDANYAPDIVFTPDSSRVFVVFPGSDRLVGWDVATGEVVVDLEIPGNPASVTRAPNGTQIAVVSLFLAENFGDAANNFEGDRIGAINMIDLLTLEIRTLNLTEVFFSFFNNLVFNADGTRAFIASAATDELLRIDLTTMSEAGPRLKFTAGTRPTPISISPDFSSLAVTLIGSVALPRDEVPDSIQIIDTESFSVVGSIVPAFEIPLPKGGSVDIPADFVGTNNLAFSADGQWGLIAEQSSSSSGFLPELANDRAVLINMETGEVDEVFAAGGVAGYSFLLPDSETLGVISATDVTFVEYNLRESWRTQDPRSQFRVSSRPAFSGNQLLIGSPIRDAVVRFDVRSGDLRNVVPVGSEYENENFTIPAGALDVSLSPDGRSIAALVFNDNSVDLFEPTRRFVIPRFVEDNTWLTGIGLTNVSEAELEVIGLGINNVGFPFADIDECEDSEDEDCENVIEVVNPQTIAMQPGEQVSFTPLGFLEAVAGQAVEGWLNLDVDASRFAGLFLALDRQVTRMDGGRLFAEGAQGLIVPHFRLEDGFASFLVVLNSSLALSSVKILLFASGGELVATSNLPIAPNGRIARPVTDSAGQINGIFPPGLFEEGERYFLELESDESLFAFVRYFDDRAMAVLEATPLAGPDSQIVDRQIAPQVVAFGGNTSTLTMINQNTEEATITLTFHPNDGELEVDPVQVVLQYRELLTEDVAQLFGLEDGGSFVSGWVELVSDRAGIVGSVEFQLFDGKAMSILPFFPEGEKRVIFSHVAQGLGFVTGVLALNPGDETATLDVILRAEDGGEVATAQLVLAPGERRAVLIEELFGEAIEQIGGRLELQSDVPVIMAEMFFSEDGEILSAVPGNVLPD